LDAGRPSQGGTTISTVTTAPALRRDGDDITDHDLVARVRAGDDRAFEALYTRYNRRIASYVQGMVHDHARAEDITQDVFMSALRRMRETDRAIAFKPWIYEIAKNACIDQFRRARRAEEVSMDADEGLGSADYGRLVSSGPTPDVAVDHKQQLDHLCGAFGGLSETHHEILVMRELEGLSYREIGEKLGMTRPAVESTLFRARRRLTEEYDQLVTGERCVRVQGIIASAGGGMGARDKRRVARHVSYCQPCMRHARLSGLDAGDLVHRPVRQKIAALLPLPAFLKERWGGTPSPDASVSLYNLSAQASTLDPGVVSTWGKAAATAATIALAGVSAGVATDPDSKLKSQISGGAVSVLNGGSDSSSSSSADPRAGGGSGSGSSGTAVTSGGAAAKGTKSSPAERSAARGGTGTATAGASAPRDGGGATTTGAAPAGGGDSGAAEPAAEDPGTAAGRLLDGVGRGTAGDSGGGGGGGGGTGGGGGGGGNAGIQAPNVELPSVQAPAAAGGGTAPSTEAPAADQKTDDPVQDVIDGATGLLGGG
jgi:RNA polymerase sigma factor (sigma-70 family)